MPDLRPATVSDLPEVLDLLQAVDRADHGTTGWTADGLAGEWAHPALDLTADSVIAVADRMALAYGHALSHAAGEVDLSFRVRAGHEHTAGKAVLAALLAAADDHHATTAGDPVVATLDQPVDGPFTPLLQSAGWTPVRRFTRMTRRLTPADIPAPQPPSGVLLRSLQDADESDIRTWHAVQTAAFAEHWGSHPKPYDTWRARYDAVPGLDWSLWWLARVDGTDAGVLSIHAPAVAGPPDAVPDVMIVGVLPAARRRGVGGSLLQTAFAELAHRGFRDVTLTVDTANVTNAASLYIGVGMRPIAATDFYSRPRSRQ